MKISVIVPVYNLEKYIRQCLESVLNQTYRDLELIVVDDGSQDGSVPVCREIAAADQRVRVIENRHDNQATARNTGIKCMSCTWGFRSRTQPVEAGAENILDTPLLLVTEILK